ncbi:MAG: methylenetetrahydrofolate reductase C-terminal domain-containing protein [Endomicrobiales bacterium]|nr:methylenetetrahydrofolate reductase C-terminal domain-containing protein [Endomicrobiales bacterium]
MIITVTKPIEEIMTNLEGYKKVFVVGCAACATKCQTGGEEAVNNMIKELKKKNKTVTGSVILDTPCDIRIAKRDLAKSREANESDVILVLACGAGVQAAEKVIEKPVLPALNPLFVGTTERIGVYNEFCSVCGECILDKTAGICPVSRCPKGLINGPCGGVVDGKCETDLTKDCVWVLILNKLKKLGKEQEIFKDYFSPKKRAKPKVVNRAGERR